MKAVQEAAAWAVIASMLEERETVLVYDPTAQPSLCESVSKLLHMGAITRRTWCKMLMRVRLFAPYSDTSTKAYYWDRRFGASRRARIMAAWWLHHMARMGEST